MQLARLLKSTARLRTPARLFSHLLTLVTIAGLSLTVSEYSFNPMKYYDDKFEAFNILSTKPRTLGESLFFARADKTFPQFMAREPVFQVPQVPLEPPFENYYSNFHSLLGLNARAGRVRTEGLKGHPKKRELLKTHGMDLESLRFRNPKTGREYDLQEIFDSKRMDPLYNLVNRLESPDFHLFLEQERMTFAENSGLKEALLSQVSFQSTDRTRSQANPIKILSKEINRNDGLYKEKKLKFYFTLNKDITKVELLDVRTDNPEVASTICNHRLMERITRYRECRDKVKMVNRFYFKLKLKYPVKLEKGGSWCIKILNDLREKRLADHIPSEWFNLSRLKRKFCKETVKTYTDKNSLHSLDFRMFNAYFFLMVDGTNPVVVSLSELIFFKSANKDFELLFLNKTSLITPFTPFANYLFIRNLHAQDTQTVDPSVADAELQVKVDSLFLEHSDDLMKGPTEFRDPSLRSQKISKEFRNKIFGKVVPGPLNDSGGYAYQINLKRESQQDFWELGPNDLRPIVEVSNGKFAVGECKSQEKSFPFYKFASSVCSQWGEDTAMCKLREFQEKGQELGDCQDLQMKYSRGRKPQTAQEELLLLEEVVQSIKYMCKENMMKADDLFDRLQDSASSQITCGQEYQSVAHLQLQDDSTFNMNTRECSGKTSYYTNFFDFCHKIDAYFPTTPQTCSSRQRKLYVFKQKNRLRGSLYKNFIEVFANQPPADFNRTVSAIKSEFLQSLNSFEIFALKLSLRKDPKLAKSLAHGPSQDEIRKVTGQFQQLLSSARDFSLFSQRLQKLDLTLEYFCPLVHAVHSMNYLNFSKKFRLNSLKVSDVKTLFFYIWGGLVRFSRGSLGPLITTPSKFDIFRETTPEYLPENRLFPFLARLLRDLGFTFKKFFSSIFRQNKKLVRARVYSSLFSEIGAGHSVLSKEFLRMVNHCHVLCPSEPAQPLFHLVSSQWSCLRCDPFYHYSQGRLPDAKQAKNLRLQLLFLVSHLLDKQDVKVCNDVRRRKEENFVLVREVKLAVNKQDYHYSFPLVIARDLLVFDHRSIDLGVVTQPGIFHLADVYVTNKAQVPVIIRRLSLFNANADFEVKLAMTYREHVLIPFQKERFILCKIISALKMSAINKGPSFLRGYIEVEVLAEGFPGLIRERIHFRMTHAKDLLRFLPGNRLSMETDGKDIEMVNSSLDDYRRFVVHLQNTAPFDLFLENYQLVEKKHLLRFYDFASVNSALLNDTRSHLIKRKHHRECTGDQCAADNGKRAQTSVKNTHFKRLKVFDPNHHHMFEEKQLRVDKKSEHHFLTVDQIKARSPESHKRSLVFSFLFLNTFLTTKLEFVHQRLDCTRYKRMPRAKPAAVTGSCFAGLELNFGYYSVHVTITNFSLEELVIRKVEVLGLEPEAELELTLITRGLSNADSSPLKNVLRLGPGAQKELNLLLFSQDQCRVKVRLAKRVGVILSKFSDRKLKCIKFKKDYELLLKASRIKQQQQAEMTIEELEQALASQVESVEKKYELEEKIRKCSQKTTLKKFRKVRRARLVIHLHGGKKFEIVIRSRNLIGELKILPEEPVVNVLFPGPNRHFKFEVLNTFGKVLKIFKVVNKPLKLSLFEAYSSKKFIPSSPKPVEFLEAYVNPRIVTLQANWGHQPQTQGNSEHFTMNDLETHFENARIIDYLKRENMMSFKAEFTVHTNIVPSISVFVTVHINEPLFFQNFNKLNLGQNSLEFQNKHHLTLNNPFNDQLNFKLFLVPKKFLEMSVSSPKHAVAEHPHQIVIQGDSTNYICMNNQYISKRNLKFFARFFFGDAILFLFHRKSVFKEQMKKCQPEFSQDCSSNALNNAVTLNEEVCFYINESNSIQNVIYLKLSNSNNYFFEISKKKRMNSAQERSNVVVFNDLSSYSEVFVQPEKPNTLARSFLQKVSKKKFDFLSLQVWKTCQQGLDLALARVFGFHTKISSAVKALFIEPEKAADAPDSPGKKGQKNTRKKAKVSQNSPADSYNYISHMTNLETFKQRKFMFLSKSLYNAKLAIPPFSSLNIPKMIMVDFNSRRFDLQANSFPFQISKSALDFPENFDPGEKDGVLDYRSMRCREIEEALDDMVLVMKNNLTHLTIIPIKTLHFQQSKQFPISKNNVRLLGKHTPQLHIKSVRAKQNHLQIQIMIDIGNYLAQTVHAELEVSSGNLLYLFTVRISTKGFRLMDVKNDGRFWRLGESLIYTLGLLGMMVFAVKLGRAAWGVYSEASLLLGYLKRDKTRAKGMKRLENARKVVIKLFDGLGKKVMRILGKISSLDKVLGLFLRIEKRSKLRSKSQKLHISEIDNHLTKERTRPRLDSGESGKEGHRHMITQQGVVKQLYMDRRLLELQDHVRAHQEAQGDLQDKWWLLKSLGQRRRCYHNDAGDIRELQNIQAKLHRPNRKKTLQVSKRLSDMSEMTSVVTGRAQPPVARKECKDQSVRRTREFPLVLDVLDFQCESLLEKVGSGFERCQSQIVFKGNPFYNSTKISKEGTSMMESAPSESASQSQSTDQSGNFEESQLSMNSLRKRLLLRENSVYWEMQHKKGFQQEKAELKIHGTSSEQESFWPTFVFCLGRKSAFGKYLARFKQKNKAFDYEQPEPTLGSSEKLSDQQMSKRPGALIKGGSTEERQKQEGKEKLYTSISRMNESHSFSIEKNLVEMIGQNPIKQKFSMEDISEPSKRRGVIPKVKSHYLGMAQKKEISNEDYFDLLDQERGSKQTRLNDIFKNFRTKKIEEKEEIMDFPFAISEEEDSQDEGAKPILGTRQILKTESYHVISSTSSFRSGKGSRFGRQNRDKRTEKGKATLVGRNANNSVYSGKKSTLSGEQKLEKSRRGNISTQKSGAFSREYKGGSFVSHKRKKSKRSKRSKRRSRASGREVKMESQESKQEERTFRGLDDTILREKKDEEERSRSPMTRREREAQIEQSIRKLEPPLIPLENKAPRGMASWRRRVPEKEPQEESFYAFADDSLGVFMPEVQDSSSSSRKLQKKKLKKKGREMKERYLKKNKRMMEQQGKLGMMYTPEFIPDPRMIPLAQQAMFPIGYGGFAGYGRMPMMQSMNTPPKSFELGARGNVSNVNLKNGMYWQYINPHMREFMRKSKHHQEGYPWKFPMEEPGKRDKLQKLHRPKQTKHSGTGLKEKVIKFDSSNDEISENSKLITSSSNLPTEEYESEDASQQIRKFFKAKEESESEEESGFNPFEKHGRRRHFERGDGGDGRDGGNRWSRDDSGSQFNQFAPRVDSPMLTNTHLKFLDSDEDSNRLLQEISDKQASPDTPYGEQATLNRFPNEHKCFLEDNFLQNVNSKDQESGDGDAEEETFMLTPHSQRKKFSNIEYSNGKSSRLISPNEDSDK